MPSGYALFVLPIAVLSLPGSVEPALLIASNRIRAVVYAATTTDTSELRPPSVLASAKNAADCGNPASGTHHSASLVPFASLPSALPHAPLFEHFSQNAVCGW